MPVDTFDSIWREVHLYAANVPPALVQNWVRDSFRDVIRKRLWSWGIREGSFVFPDAESTGTIALTYNSTTVTGTGTAFASSHVGQQIKIENHVFTVSAVASSTSLTIDRVWPDDTASGQSFTILQAYVTVPTDFKAFLSVVDPDNNWRIRTHLDIRDIDAWDASRSDSGSPVALVDLRWNQSPTTNSNIPRPMYEVWPHVTEQKEIKYLYWIIHPDISESQDLPYTVGGEVVKLGALWRLCRWPGTTDIVNPMFNIREASDFKKQFEMRLNELEREDKEIYPNDLWYEFTSLPYAPLDSAFYQRHAY